MEWSAAGEGAYNEPADRCEGEHVRLPGESVARGEVSDELASSAAPGRTRRDEEEAKTGTADPEEVEALYVTVVVVVVVCMGLVLISVMLSGRRE